MLGTSTSVPEPPKSVRPPSLASLTIPVMTFATLRALHTVIGDALTELERVYAARSAESGTSLDYPSLDVPYYHNNNSANAQSSAEAEAAEKLAEDPAVVMTANHIVAACEQLAVSVHRPFFTLTEGIMSVRFSSVHVLRAPGGGRQGDADIQCI